MTSFKFIGRKSWMPLQDAKSQMCCAFLKVANNVEYFSSSLWYFLLTLISNYSIGKLLLSNSINNANPINTIHTPRMLQAHAQQTNAHSVCCTQNMINRPTIEQAIIDYWTQQIIDEIKMWFQSCVFCISELSLSSVVSVQSFEPFQRKLSQYFMVWLSVIGTNMKRTINENCCQKCSSS